MIKHFGFIFLVIFALLHPCISSPLHKKHIIKKEETYVDAKNMHISPGDTVCLMAGEKTHFKLVNLHGSDKAPVVIINCGGEVIISSKESGFGFSIENSSYFKLTGTGDVNSNYGIKILSTGKGASGLSLGTLSTDFEVEFIEIAHTGFAGILSKTDPSCDGKGNRGNFIQKNISFHHNYIHDTHGEGFYVGSSFYNGQTKKCNNQPVKLYPHDIHNVAIYENIVVNTGWDGIQLGCATEGARIYNNTIENYGTLKAYGQRQGIQVASGTSGSVYNNTIKGGNGIGIFMNGLGGNVVHNNLIIDPAEDGIFCDDRATKPGTGFYFINNTIIRPGRDGIRMYSIESKGNKFMNNIIVAAKEKYVNKRTKVDWTELNNLFTADIKSVGFIDAANNNYQLQASSPAINGGADVSAYNIKFKNNKLLKSYGNKFPLGAHPAILVNK